MFAPRFRVVSVLSLTLAAACGGGGEEASADAATDTTMAAPAADASMPPAAPADSAMAGQTSGASTVQMTAVGGSGVTGQAQIMGHGAGETMVTVTLQGTGSGTHPGHVHQGTCENLGSVVAPLQDLTMAGGTGTSTTTLQVPMATVMNGQHVVNFHAGSGENPMAPVACGAIPAQAAAS